MGDRQKTRQIKQKREWFSLREAASISKLTPAMVDYLSRSGTFLPSISREVIRKGKWRHYTFRDLIILRALAGLIDHGISVKKLKKALCRLQKDNKSGITLSNSPDKFLVTNGKTIYFVDKDHIVEDLLADGQLAFGFVIELQKVHDSVKRAVNNLPAPGARRKAQGGGP